MSDKSQRQLGLATGPGAGPSTQQSSDPPEATPSNAEQADIARSEEGTAAGLANYESSLGQWLGGELYGAVAPYLTLDKIGDKANDGLMQAFKILVSKTSDLDDDVSEKDLEDFSNALKETYGTIASEWLTGDGKPVADALANWVDAHPGLVVTTALLAAAGAIVANADIPEITKDLNLGDDLNLKLSARIGRLRNIALEKISADLSWTSGPLVAAMKVSHEDGDTNTDVKATLGGEERQLTAQAKLDGSDLTLIGVSGLLKTGDSTIRGSVEQAHTDNGKETKIGASIEHKDGKVTRTDDLEYQAETGVLTIKNATEFKDGDLSVAHTHSSSSAGTESNKLSLSTPLSAGLTGSASLESLLNANKVGSAYELSKEQKISLGLDYSMEDLDAALDLSTSSGGSGSISGSISQEFDERWSLGGDITQNWGDSSKLEAGAFFGYRDPDEFKTYLAKYRFIRDDLTTQEIDLLVEDRLGPIYARLQQQIAFSSAGTSLETTAQGAYFLNEDLALIGGARYRRNDLGEHNIAPQLGVQVGGVPLIVTHDFENNTTMVGITLKFGR